jgi:hypothetical protein
MWSDAHRSLIEADQESGLLDRAFGGGKLNQ